MKILCPTDFSDHSKKALAYAIQLADILQGELHVLHAYQVPRKTASFVSIDDIIHDNREKDMEWFIAAVNAAVDDTFMPITKVAQGDTSRMISSYCTSHDIGLIVMGTQGSNSVSNLLFGSTTKKIAADSQVPVLAIPANDDLTLKGYKMVLALDEQNIENLSVLDPLIQIAKSAKSTIDIIHVYNDMQGVSYDRRAKDHLMEVFDQEHLISHDRPIAAIKEFATNNEVGLIAMIRREKNFFQRLLTERNTSLELAQTNVPLMIIPE